MLQPVPRSMSVEEFHSWHETQDIRHELIDGYPVQVMAGARQSHNVAVNNITFALTPSARASGCRSTSSDTAVRTGPATLRYPDVVVDCGPKDKNAKEASRPTVVVEVSSESTRNVDFSAKLAEYQKIDSVQTILLVDPNQVLVVAFFRKETGEWDSTAFRDLSDEVDVGPLRITLPLAEIYRDLEPEEKPGLRTV